MKWIERLRDERPDNVHLVYSSTAEHAMLRGDDGITILREVINFVYCTIAPVKVAWE